MLHTNPNDFNKIILHAILRIIDLQRNVIFCAHIHIITFKQAAPAKPETPKYHPLPAKIEDEEMPVVFVTTKTAVCDGGLPGLLLFLIVEGIFLP